MDYYLESVKFSQLSMDEAQELLVRFIKNAQPTNLKYSPKIIEYSDELIVFELQKHSILQSISVDLLLRNGYSTLNPFGEEVTDFDYNYRNNGFFKTKVGDIEYIDNDIIKIAHFTIIIRLDSITKLISGGMNEFLKNENVYGCTNGMLISMAEMRDNPDVIAKLYYSTLEPKGFKYRKDFVWGYCGLYEKDKYWKPIEWCVVPWLESVITPDGNYAKFIKQDNESLIMGKQFNN